MLVRRFCCLLAWLGLMEMSVTRGLAADPPSLPPMRPLPQPVDRPLPDGSVYFVDAAQGNDTNDGSRDKPWQTIEHSLRQIAPGSTLCLRGGVFYEHVDLPVSGEEQKPIVVRSHPGELAVIDGGLREFFDDPQSAWKPQGDGAAHEFVSTKTYPQFRARPVLSSFPAAGWEPFHGKEDQRPAVLGHFADSMIPLHGYRTLTDLRDDSMLWDVDNKFQNDEGVYCGPGLWFNRKTARIHIRLAHTTLNGRGKNSWRGETDPRRVRLHISGPVGADVLRLNGVRNVVIQDLVLRGASGSPLINLSGSEHITFDGVTAFGGSPGLLAKATSQVKIVNCAFRSLAAPWSSRASMKYRGTPSYVIITQRNKPECHDWEIAWSEFTDGHDGLWLRYVRDLKFHHNLVDRFNDDGLESGARKRDHKLTIYQNLISRCLLTFTLHEMDQDESPPEVDPGSGVYITRNIIDLRQGTFSAPPREPVPAGASLLRPCTLCGDHGSPTWPNYFFYHNTVLRADTAWRGYYGFGIGGRATRGTTRRVLNNIFVQIAGVPGISFASGPDDNFVDGNLHWGLRDGPAFEGDFLAKSRTGAFRRASIPKGWLAHDRFANPRFRQFTDDATARFDVTIPHDSPAVNAGVIVPEQWFDPLRHTDSGSPDIGALPAGTRAASVGVRGRLSLSN